MKFKALSLLFPIKSIITEEESFVDSCARSHHNSHHPDVSPDLQDKHGTFQLTDNGFPVTGNLLPEQFHVGTQSPALPIYLALWSVVAMFSGILGTTGITSIGTLVTFLYIVGFIGYFGLGATVLMGVLVLAPGLVLSAIAPYLSQLHVDVENVAIGIALLPAFLPLVYSFFKTRREASRLAYEGAVSKGAVLAAPRSLPNAARLEQDANDLKDKAHFIQLGRATGRLAKNGDELAPDRGLPFGAKTSDFSKHLIIFGATGSGKTTGGLRPVWMGYIHEEKETGERFGAFVGDGKAQLPNDFKAHLDYLIHPSLIKHFNVLEGISPEVFARSLEKVNVKGKSSGNADYFNSSARNLIYYAALFHDAFVSMGLEVSTLSTRLKIISEMCQAPDAEGKTEIITKIQQHPDFATPGTLINDAVNKFMALQELATETRSSVFSTAESWILPLMQSAALRPWADSEKSEFDFKDVLYGKKFGFSLPEAEFGIAGIAITALMKARLFQLITERNKNRKALGQSKVLLMIDEAQRVVDEGDIAMIAMAREWGLTFVYATQNIESFEEKFGAAGTQVILDSFRNIIVLKADEKTMEYAARRIGKAIVWSVQGQSQTVDFGLTSKLALANPVLDPNNPYGGWMRHFGFGFFKWMSNAKKSISSQVTELDKPAIIQASKEPQFIVHAADIQATNEPFVAIAIVERAGVSRRDVIKTQPLDENFKPFTAKAPTAVMVKEAA